MTCVNDGLMGMRGIGALDVMTGEGDPDVDGPSSDEFPNNSMSGG